MVPQPYDLEVTFTIIPVSLWPELITMNSVISLSETKGITLKPRSSESQSVVCPTIHVTGQHPAVPGVQLSVSVMSDSLRSHELQHTRPPCPSTPSPPKPMSIESVMPSSHLILCHPLLLPPSIFPSIRVFSNESTLRIRWPKDWSFSFNISPSTEHPGLISFSAWRYITKMKGVCVQDRCPVVLKLFFLLLF